MHCCSLICEYMKVANIVVTDVLGSVEDERTFSTLKFMKLKLRNSLGGHLDAHVVSGLLQPRDVSIPGSNLALA
jgi:hypothetical protein